MKNKILGLIFTVAILLSPQLSLAEIIENENASSEIEVTTLNDSTENGENRAELPDISKHNYKTAIQYLYQKRIIDGYPDGYFRPNFPINRAEFVKMIVNAKYDLEQETNLEKCFPDVQNEWFAKYVCFAKSKGIIDGYPNGLFQPEQNINFVEASKIVVKTNAINHKTDSSKPWYYGFVESLEDKKFVPPSINSLDKFITRGELSEILWRILEEKSDQESVKILPVMNFGPSDWSVYSSNGFSFSHPGWVGYERHGWMYLSDEMKNITGLDTKDYIIVDTYLATYSTNGNELNTKVWFSHPLVKTENVTVNGLPALKREFRAYPGDVMNGRTVGYDEVIMLYTYQLNGKILSLQFFNAHPPTQNDYLKIYQQIAETVRAS